MSPAPRAFASVAWSGKTADQRSATSWSLQSALRSASGLSSSAIRRHLGQHGVLGAVLIRRRHDASPPDPIEPLREAIDDEGGPILDHHDEADEAVQRRFDATCRALLRFLDRPAGKAVVSPRRRRTVPPAVTAALDALIEQATTDAHGESEQAVGFLTAFQDGITVPFITEVLGVPVTVIGFDVGDDDALVTCCRRGRSRQRIPVQDLPMPEPPPTGHEWIVAYRRWLRGT